ncbi:hypothetical protein J6590_089685 [Homalodisca vitripennis]|nr:hypothetical protein J6590_089685 [Homalodisca vitripennis]
MEQRLFYLQPIGQQAAPDDVSTQGSDSLTHSLTWNGRGKVMRACFAANLTVACWLCTDPRLHFVALCKDKLRPDISLLKGAHARRPFRAIRMAFLQVEILGN